jgi:hypothetical protein
LTALWNYTRLLGMGIRITFTGLLGLWGLWGYR